MSIDKAFLDELRKIAKENQAITELQRLVEESHGDRWAEGRTRFLSKTYTPEELRKKLIPVKGDRGQLVGFIDPRPGKEGGTSTGYIYITPSERGKGYGSQALREFGEKPRTFSFVDKKNIQSQRAHEAAGWIRSGKHGQGRPNSEMWVPGSRKPEVRQWLAKVQDEAKQKGFNVFAVAEDPSKKSGASITTVKGSKQGAVRHARKAHTQWEQKHGYDPYHDWRKTAAKLVQKTFDFKPLTSQEKARFGSKGMGSTPKRDPFKKPPPEHILSQAKKNPEGFKQLAQILRQVIEKNGGFVKLGLAPANTMPFPSEYNRSLRSGTKNSTVRVGAERGRYQKGGVYAATSYTGQPLGVRLKVLSVETVPLSGVDALTRVGTSESIQRKHNTQPNELVDVVRFEVLGGM